MSTARKIRPDKSRMPAHSTFYDKVVPLLLLGMAVLTVVFIAIAAGVLLGLVPYQ